MALLGMAQARVVACCSTLDKNPSPRSPDVTEAADHDHDVKKWELRRLLKQLDEYVGEGTSMVSLIIPAEGQLSRTSRLLSDELSTSACIKSRTNRQSVQSAIVSAQQRLKLYRSVPRNGLTLFCGTVQDKRGKQKRLCIDYEPFQPLSRSVYLCDSKFHTEELRKHLEDNEAFGFIIIDGHCSLFAVIRGSSRTILHKITVSLPPKHGRGGQSAARFARIREEKRNNYLKKVSEVASSLFLTDKGVSVKGLVLGGSADFKVDLNKSIVFDDRLRSKVLKIVDVAYSGENGLNQAVDLSREALSSLKFVREKTLIGRFFDEIARGSQMVAYGVSQVVCCLESGTVDTLLMWEDLSLVRCTLRNKNTGEEIVQVLDPGSHADKTNSVWETINETQCVEWALTSARASGVQVEILTDQSPEGAQFCSGFGGLGAFLRYAVTELHVDEKEDDASDYSDDD